MYDPLRSAVDPPERPYSGIVDGCPNKPANQNLPDACVDVDHEEAGIRCEFQTDGGVDWLAEVVLQ